MFSDVSYSKLSKMFTDKEIDAVHNRLRGIQDYPCYDRNGLGCIVYYYYYLILCKLDLSDWVE